ncbi:MAG TPA: MSEP-CTERM sorting domain-containing protein, partial [Bacteroidia bacterium]
SELKSTLNRIKEISNSGRRNSLSNYPFLSAYHDFIVFDNMMLSTNRIDKLNQIYFNEARQIHETETPSSSLIHSYAVKSQYDQKRQAWVSMVELTVGVDQGRGLLFTTDFKLPKGVWVSNYFLDIGKKREYGILAEKKSAEWVFRQITNENRDPGIISYLNNNTLRLSVFPCNASRITGIEFTHYNPVKIKIEDKTIQLGDSTKTISKGIESENYRLLTSEEKKSLKTVIRKPRVHFIINNNDYSFSEQENLRNTMQQFLIRNRIPLTDGHTANLPNVSNQTYEWDQIPNDAINKNKQLKGFYPVFNIRKTLTESYKNSSEFFPLIILLNNFTNAMIMEKDFSELQMCYPDHPYFYELRSDGKLNSHKLDSISYKTIDTLDEIKPYDQVFEYKSGDIKRFLKKDEETEIVLKRFNEAINEENLTPKSISSAIDIQASSMTEALNPKLAHENWHKMLRSSFKTGFLTPNTSFISLENQAQKNILKHKQRMALLGEREGEFEELSRTFSEPGEWIIYCFLLGLFAYMAIRHKRLKRKVNSI